MATKEELIKFIGDSDFDEEVIGQIFAILKNSKVENSAPNEEEPKEPREETIDEKKKKVEEIFG